MTFVLPILAVFIGFFITLLFKPLVTNWVKLLLSFSGAFLLSTTVFEFLPKLYAHSNKNISLFIMAGVLLQILLEYISRGAEHGHVHLDKERTHIPWLLFTSLCVHAIIEGFPLSYNTGLMYGIVIHKIPIAVIIGSFLMLSKLSKEKILIFLIVFALMTPLGSFLGTIDFWPEGVKPRIDALVVGVLLHVSTTILFESSKNHQFNASKFAVIVLGITIAYFI